MTATLSTVRNSALQPKPKSWEKEWERVPETHSILPVQLETIKKKETS
jgi:hypothetical protein